MLRKKKKEKKKHLLGQKEFIFNFLSILAMMGVCLYYGGRSLYYYSKQNVKIKEEAMTLNGLVLQNNPIARENNDGLHQDNDGYYFKGAVENNYVLFENRIFRVIRVNGNDTVKMISENFNASFMWGEESNYKDSNVRNWLEKTDKEHSGVYYSTIPKIEEKLVKTKYSEDKLKNDKIINAKDNSKDYVTVLTVKDYIQANGKSSYLNNGKIFFLLGLNEDDENLYVEEDGSIQSSDSLSGYGIRPVITLKKNMEVSGGDGTKDNPYVVKTNDKNYVDSYIKLGDDTWKVSSDNGEVLKLYLNDYLKINGAEVSHNYSIYNSIFALNDRSNIGYYLNTTYLGSLPYQDSLVDCNYFTGEISDDTGYSFTNIYSDNVTAKVGLLNIFDYISNNELSDYFHINTTSQVGSMEYNVYSNGLLEEADVRDSKHIVPVVCISKNSIKSGDGTNNNPYKME
ncbi:MAG: hypothetical protein IJ097_01665 [Bacilli bacterium]|nr:hypothetical protein [Bacilli bacterium]